MQWHAFETFNALPKPLQADSGAHTKTPQNTRNGVLIVIDLRSVDDDKEQVDALGTAWIFGVSFGSRM